MSTLLTKGLRFARALVKGLLSSQLPTSVEGNIEAVRSIICGMRAVRIVVNTFEASRTLDCSKRAVREVYGAIEASRVVDYDIMREA